MEVIKVNNKALAHNSLLMRVVCILYKSHASDVLFIPKNQQVMIKLKYFQDKSEDIGHINIDNFQRMLFNIKLGCNLNIFDNQIQSGSFTIQINNIPYSFRVSLHPTSHGTNLAIRILRQEFFQSLPIGLPKGLTIIAGKTGSGKTTHMYSIISNFPGHVISLEDPVEYHFNHITQTDVSICGYENGIKSALRQTPDLICIGEIRDYQSAQAAIRAALTGHAVITTLHALNEDTIISRLSELGCNHYQHIINNIIFLDRPKLN
jgi:type II secretory ATPase GspE/PulE/Tfp pilus assembly ATPase PilB-like protein